MEKLRGKLFRAGVAGLAGLALSLVLAAAPAKSASYFVYDQWGGTWKDANKSALNTEDDLMCWAAAGSNVLSWGNWGTSTYNTTGKIFKQIRDHWTDNAGYPTWAWKWWLNGSPPPYNTYSYIDVPGGGNFYPNLNANDYYTAASTGNLMTAVNTMMHQGKGVALIIRKGAAAHAITAWGYEYQASESTILYHSIFVTDSDDGKTALMNYPLVWQYNGWYLGGGYSGWRLTNVYGFGNNPTEIVTISLIPEVCSPAGALVMTPLAPTHLLLGTGLVILCLGRRLLRGKNREQRRFRQ